MNESLVPGRSPRLAAVVLTGGSGVRLGGADKASIEVDGTTLLERAVSATAAAEEVVVVGEPVPTSRPVTWAREDPPRGGPAAGVLAGLDALRLDPGLVLVLAVDMPHVTASTVARLVHALSATPDADGAVIVDADGRQQTLAGVYRYGALAAARPSRREDEHGLPFRRLVGGMHLVTEPAIGQEARDVDTWEDLRNLGG